MIGLAISNSLINAYCTIWQDSGEQQWLISGQTLFYSEAPEVSDGYRKNQYPVSSHTPVYTPFRGVWVVETSTEPGTPTKSNGSSHNLKSTLEVYSCFGSVEVSEKTLSGVDQRLKRERLICDIGKAYRVGTTYKNYTYSYHNVRIFPQTGAPVYVGKSKNGGEIFRTTYRVVYDIS